MLAPVSGRAPAGPARRRRRGRVRVADPRRSAASRSCTSCGGRAGSSSSRATAPGGSVPASGRRRPARVPARADVPHGRVERRRLTWRTRSARRGRSATSSVIEFPGYEPPAWVDDDERRAGNAARAAARTRAARARRCRRSSGRRRTPIPSGRCRCSSSTTGPSTRSTRRCCACSTTSSTSARSRRCARRCCRRPATATRPTRRRRATRTRSRASCCRRSRAARRPDRPPVLHGREPRRARRAARALSAHPASFGGLFLQSGSFFRRRFDKHESGFAALRADHALRRRRSHGGAAGFAPRSRRRSRAAPPRRTSTTTARSRPRSTAPRLGRAHVLAPRRAQLDRAGATRCTRTSPSSCSAPGREPARRRARRRRASLAYGHWGRPLLAFPSELGERWDWEDTRHGRRARRRCSTTAA